MGVIEQHPTAEGPRYSAPTPITAEHRADDFACGKTSLDDWLKAHGFENEGKASRTYVVVPKGSTTIVGYYTLATGSVPLKEVPRKIRHGLPNPVPVMVLGRLAVDARHSGKGIGPAMLREALKRTLGISREAGVRALIVHAIDDEAVNFYTKYGFQQFPAGTRTMFLPIETLAASL